MKFFFFFFPVRKFTYHFELATIYPSNKKESLTRFRISRGKLKIFQFKNFLRSKKNAHTRRPNPRVKMNEWMEAKDKSQKIKRKKKKKRKRIEIEESFCDVELWIEHDFPLLLNRNNKSWHCVKSKTKKKIYIEKESYSMIYNDINNSWIKHRNRILIDKRFRSVVTICVRS